MVAACHVLNGFGKTQGLVQVDELGTLETPIALTNTLNVGLVADALVEYYLKHEEERREIAQNGYQKIKQHLSYEKQVCFILEHI